jgi:hypothetical protein
MKLIKSAFYIAFIFLCFTVLGIVEHLQQQDNCECNTGWKPENLKLISQIGIVLGGINLLLPLNKTLYSIPLVSGIFSILVLGVIVMYLFTMVRYFRNLRQQDSCRKTCKVKSGNEGFINMVSTSSTVNILLVAFVIGIGMLYL